MQAVNLALETEKVLVRGEKFYKILKYSAYKLDELPIKYLQSLPICYMDDEGKLVVIFSDESCIEMVVGGLVPEKSFKKTLRTIRYCGHRLHLINEEIKEMKKSWQGIEKFEI